MFTCDWHRAAPSIFVAEKPPAVEGMPEAGDVPIAALLWRAAAVACHLRQSRSAKHCPWTHPMQGLAR